MLATNPLDYDPTIMLTLIAAHTALNEISPPARPPVGQRRARRHL